MKIVPINPKTKISVEGIRGFIRRKVTPFGTSAKVDCPKEYLGHEVYLVILEKEGKNEKQKSNRRISKTENR